MPPFYSFWKFRPELSSKYVLYGTFLSCPFEDMRPKSSPSGQYQAWLVTRPTHTVAKYQMIGKCIPNIRKSLAEIFISVRYRNILTAFPVVPIIGCPSTTVVPPAHQVAPHGMSVCVVKSAAQPDSDKRRHLIGRQMNTSRLWLAVITKSLCK